MNDFDFYAGYARYNAKRGPKTEQDYRDKTLAMDSVKTTLTDLIVKNAIEKLSEGYEISSNEPVLPELVNLPDHTEGWVVYDGGWLEQSIFLTTKGILFLYNKNLRKKPTTIKHILPVCNGKNLKSIKNRCNDFEYYLEKLCRFAVKYFGFSPDSITEIGKKVGIEIMFGDWFVLIS